MRVALLVASPTIQGVLAERLGRAGAGFEVHAFAATADVLREVARVLDDARVGPDDSVLFYFAGPAGFDGEPAADAEGAASARPAAGAGTVKELGLAIGGGLLGLRDLRDKLTRRAPRSVLALLELTHAGEPDDVMAALEQVDGATRAIATSTSGVSLLVASRSIKAAPAGALPAFTDLVLETAEDPACRDAETHAVLAGAVYERVRDLPRLYAEVPSCTYRAAAREFELLPPPEGAAPKPKAAEDLELDRVLKGASEAVERGQLADALVEWKKALMLLGEGRAPERADVYFQIARIKLAESKEREAVFNWEKALSTWPAHRGAEDALVDYYTGQQDWWRMIGIRRRALAAITDANERYATLVQIGRAWLVQANDPRRAAEAFEEAVLLRPGEPTLLRRLVEIYEGLGEWAKVLDTVARISEADQDPSSRAKDHVLMGDLARSKLKDEARALALYEKALLLDPRLLRALDALTDLRNHQGESALLERALTAHAEKLPAGRDHFSGHLWTRVARLRLDHLHDAASAIEAFRRSIAAWPADAEVHASLAKLLEQRGDVTGAIDELAEAAHRAPRHGAHYHELFRLCAGAGKVDRALFAAAALEELEAADIDEQLYLDQHRPAPDPIRPIRAVDAASFYAAVSHVDADPHATAILEAVGKAAVAVRLEQMSQAGTLPVLDPSQKQDLETSTVTLVRSFRWASHLLDVKPPALYLREEVTGGIAAAPAKEPTLVVARSMLSGLTMADLAFVTGRYLVYFWPAHWPLVGYPTLADLSVLLLAAIKLALPEVPVPPELSPSVTALRRALAANIDAADRARLERAVRAFDESGAGRVDLAGWVRAVELCAARAGFVLAGGLGPAKKMFAKDTRPLGDLTAEDRLSDLLGYSVSADYAALRASLGIALPDHMPTFRPPPMAAQPKDDDGIDVEFET